MGRPTWGTDEQVAFLEGFVDGLDEAKLTCTLTTEYERIYGLFVQRWPTIPTELEQAKESDPTKLQAKAEKRRRNVSFSLSSLSSGHTLIVLASKLQTGSRHVAKLGRTPSPKIFLTSPARPHGSRPRISSTMHTPSVTTGIQTPRSERR